MEEELLYTQEDIDEWAKTCEELQDKIKEQEETIEQLLKYKRLEEQGLIVRLPFKVKQDKDGFFYYIEPLDEIDKKLGLKKKKIYLAFVQTVCDDFKEAYCYGDEFYDRHFTDNDDTIEIKLIKAEKENCGTSRKKVNYGRKNNK